eukprot:TRINITY_DN67753_c9_g2_i1.p1 TRINITY_DN67753_c9_g2~~TRINITY_DN67753_c9_g2_i1.p1  ORF type:complete len:498 (+),score=242.11 TRINITY_DN67753_c9_g2_i1:194-1495(+)
MALSNRQKAELDKAILAYLSQQGYDEAYASLAAALDVKEPPGQKYHKLLEKKWTSIVRLQRKIMGLEQQVEQLSEDVKNAGKGKKVDVSEALPREPARHVLNGHRGPITRVLFHPVFNVLVSASEDSTVKMWDYESGQFERTIKAHTDAVQDVAFNTDGSLLATCSSDLSIKLWDMETYQNRKTLNGHDHNVSCVRFVPGDANILVSASRDKTIKVWDTTTGYCTKTLQGHLEWVRQVRVSPNGELLVSCSMDQTVRTWNLKTGENLRTMRDHDHVVETIEFTNSKKMEQLIETMLAQAEGRDPPRFDSSDSDDDRKTASGRVADDGTGKYIVSASRDKTVRVWETATGRLIKTLRGHDNWVRSIVFHPSGRYILTSADDKTIRVWDISKQYRNTKTIDNAHPLFVSSIAWNRTFPVLASGGVDNSVRVWECR